MSLQELGSALRQMYQSVPEQNCIEQFYRPRFFGLPYLFSFSSTASVQSYLKDIGKLFQIQMQDLMPVLKSYEIFLKKMCEENIVDPRDFKESACKIEDFYQAIHPFLVLLQKHRRGVLPEIHTRNITQILSYSGEPFQFEHQPLLCRVRAIMALEGLYLGPLPYAFLKTVSRNYGELWIKKIEDNRYHDGLLGFIKQVNAHSANTNWIRVVIKGLRALVDHFQMHHHVEGTAKASFSGLLMGFYMTSETADPKKRNWLQTRDTDLIKWRKSLKKGMKLYLNGQEIILGNRLKRKHLLPQKKEDSNHIFTCGNFAEKVVVIPQNQAMLSLLSLFHNTAIPLYEIYDVDLKGRFALIERLYPLSHSLTLYPLSEETKQQHPIIKAFDDVTKDNSQPSNFDEELLLVDKTGTFKAIGIGERIPLQREILEKVVLSLVNNNFDQYRLFIFESRTMSTLHLLCTDLMLMSLGLEENDKNEIFLKWRISELEDCTKFCERVEKLKRDVHYELLRKAFDQETLNLNNQVISAILLDTFYYLRVGPDLDRIVPAVCEKFVELSNTSKKGHVTFHFKVPH